MLIKQCLWWLSWLNVFKLLKLLTKKMDPQDVESPWSPTVIHGLPLQVTPSICNLWIHILYDAKQIPVY